MARVKNASTSELLSSIQNSKDVWIADDRLGRLVGSFQPLFRKTKQEASFEALLKSSRNMGFWQTYQFQESLQSEIGVFDAMFDALKNPNLSRGTTITHAKFLCLTSALMNPRAPTQKKNVLLKNNARVFEDRYYRDIRSRLGISG